MHQLNSFNPPDIGHNSVKQALAGVKRSRLELPNQKRPILPAHLEKIYDHLSLVPSGLGVAFWCACLFACYSIRKSNMFAEKCSTRSTAQSHLRVSDVALTQGGMTLLVRVIKTSRFLHGEIQIPLPEIPTSKLCPVRAHKLLRKKAGVIPSDPLFQWCRTINQFLWKRLFCFSPAADLAPCGV